MSLVLKSTNWTIDDARPMAVNGSIRELIVFAYKIWERLRHSQACGV